MLKYTIRIVGPSNSKWLIHCIPADGEDGQPYTALIRYSLQFVGLTLQVMSTPGLTVRIVINLDFIGPYDKSELW